MSLSSKGNWQGNEKNKMKSLNNFNLKKHTKNTDDLATGINLFPFPTPQANDSKINSKKSTYRGLELKVEMRGEER